MGKKLWNLLKKISVLSFSDEFQAKIEKLLQPWLSEWGIKRETVSYMSFILKRYNKMLNLTVVFTILSLACLVFAFAIAEPYFWITPCKYLFR